MSIENNTTTKTANMGQPSARPPLALKHSTATARDTAAATAQPSAADRATATAKHDASLMRSLAKAAADYVKGSTRLISALVEVLIADTWTRVQLGQDSRRNEFRSWARAWMVSKGITEATAHIYATAAEGAAAIDRTAAAKGLTLNHCAVSLTNLGNVGRAADMDACADALLDTPRKAGRGIGAENWAEALKRRPKDCAAREGRPTDQKNKAQQVVSFAMRLCGQDAKNAMLITRTALNILTEKAHNEQPESRAKKSKTPDTSPLFHGKKKHAPAGTEATA